MTCRKKNLFSEEQGAKKRLFLSLLISAALQLGILFGFFYIQEYQNQEKDFLPISILPYSNSEEPKKEASRPVEEPKEPSDSGESSLIQNSQSSEGKAGSAEFFSFVRVDEIAKPIQSLRPQYPEMARSANVEGTVVLEVYIDANGKVYKINVIKGIGFGCEEAAIAQIKATSFIPAKMKGQPVAVRQTISFEFKLK